MNLNTLFTRSKESVTTINISGKDVEVSCSSSADRMLVMRTTPLIVELELAFACFVRKKVHFHETSTSLNVTPVNGKLALLISTIVPDTCEITTKAENAATMTLRNFLPRRVRVDFVKGKWLGDYSL